MAHVYYTTCVSASTQLTDPAISGRIGGQGHGPPPTIVDVSLTSCMLPPSLVPILCYNIVFYMLMYVWELGVLEDDVHMLCVHLLQPKSVVHVLYSLTIV